MWCGKHNSIYFLHKMYKSSFVIYFNSKTPQNKNERVKQTEMEHTEPRWRLWGSHGPGSCWCRGGLGHCPCCGGVGEGSLGPPTGSPEAAGQSAVGALAPSAAAIFHPSLIQTQSRHTSAWILLWQILWQFCQTVKKNIFQIVFHDIYKACMHIFPKKTYIPVITPDSSSVVWWLCSCSDFPKHPPETYPFWQVSCLNTQNLLSWII